MRIGWCGSARCRGRVVTRWRCTRRLRSGFRSIDKGRNAVIGLPVFLIGHAGRVVVRAGDGDDYFVRSRIIVDIRIIARLLCEVVDIGAGLVKRQGIKGDAAALVILCLQPVGICPSMILVALRVTRAACGVWLLPPEPPEPPEPPL